MAYFENFELLTYDNALAFNITQRAAILSSVFGDNFAFYPYQVKNGMRPEQVAEKYYGDSKFEWLVYFSNNIIDPYHEWTMDDDTFLAYIIDKYGSLSDAHNTIMEYRINWYEDTRDIPKIQYDSLPAVEKKYWTPIFDNNNYVQSYIRKQMDFVAVAQDGDGNVTLSIPEEEASYWTAVSAYDLEEEANARKAHIRLLDNRLASVAESNLRQLLRV